MQRVPKPELLPEFGGKRVELGSGIDDHHAACFLLTIRFAPAVPLPLLLLLKCRLQRFRSRVDILAGCAQIRMTCGTLECERVSSSESEIRQCGLARAVNASVPRELKQ